MIRSRPRVRAVAQAVCVVGLLLAAVLVGVGLAGTRGYGTVGLLDTALLLCLPLAALAFVAVAVSILGSADMRTRTPRLRRPYGYAVMAAGALALATMVVSITTRAHITSARSTTCTSGFCRSTGPSLTVVPVSPTQHLEDQSAGAVFAGGWSVAAQTIALAALRGGIEMRPRRWPRD